MAQIIAKFGYLKGKSRGGYAKYIATREGVEKVDESLRGRPVTQAQQEFIQKLLEDFPDSKELWEYEDYQKSPTLGSASEFISATIELHAGEVMNRSGYLKYMGTRPRVEKQGSHGLFSYDGEPISLNKVAQEVDAHRGNIWTVIYSLRREDAQRLGYDSASRWRDLLRAQAGKLAEGLKIAPSHLKWYAAFHNEGHHPHVHLIAYSTKPGEGFLTKQGMEKIRSALAQEIFRQDLVSVYEQQTAHRDELRRVSREKVAGLVQQISGGACENPKLESLLRELAGQLSNVKGKKVYGYLRPELKALVNQIVDELAKDERIAQLYDLWYQDKQAARNIYDERPLQRVPLSENPDFKPVRNAVIQAAIMLPSEPLSPVEDDEEPEIKEPPLEEPFEFPPAFPQSRGKRKTFWTEDYQEARQTMYGDQATPPDLPLAVRLMRQLADGNPLAAHDLGVLLLKGMGCQADEDEAQRWFQKALAGFQKAAATEKKSAYFQYRVGKMYAMGYGVEQDYLEAARWYERAVQDNNYPFAAYALGCLYLRGQGVERDEELALELFLTAAEKGNPYAQYLLGKIYYWGNGVEQDREKGLEYIQLAAEQGHPGAVRFLERLSQGEQDAYSASLFPMATRLLLQVGQIFRRQFNIDPPVARLVDKKLRQKIAEKKLAHGQKLEM